MASKGSQKLAVRSVIVALFTVGAFLFLEGIYVFGTDQAITIALLVLFIGALWLIGARGMVATIVGIVVAIIVFLILGGSVMALPPDSFIKQILQIIWGGFTAVGNFISTHFPR